MHVTRFRTASMQDTQTRKHVSKLIRQAQQTGKHTNTQARKQSNTLSTQAS